LGLVSNPGSWTATDLRVGGAESLGGLWIAVDSVADYSGNILRLGCWNILFWFSWTRWGDEGRVAGRGKKSFKNAFPQLERKLLSNS
jgi:hypothetical protein